MWWDFVFTDIVFLLVCSRTHLLSLTMLSLGSLIILCIVLAAWLIWQRKKIKNLQKASRNSGPPHNGRKRVGFGEVVSPPQWERGCAPPRIFFASVWCILHMTRQFTTPVLIRLKPAKSSDIITKPCKVVIILRISNLVMTSAKCVGN